MRANEIQCCPVAPFFVPQQTCSESRAHKGLFAVLTCRQKALPQEVIVDAEATAEATAKPSSEASSSDALARGTLPPQYWTCPGSAGFKACLLLLVHCITTYMH